LLGFLTLVKSALVLYQHVWSSSLSKHLSFLVLVGLNLSFDCFPVYFDVASVVFHRFVSFFSAVLLQEALSVGNYCVNMSLVLHSNLQGAIPSVQLNVKFDSTIE